MSAPTPDERSGLYLHVPFCSKICPYCDFSVLTGGAAEHERFVRTLSAEIAMWSKERPDGWLGPAFDTIYFGGGTPSALAPEQIGVLLDSIRCALDVEPGARIFFEANPEDATEEALAELRRLDVRTLSLGVQSFDEGELRFLGRRHDPDDSRRAVERARAAGFETVSIDLIFGLPGQDLARWTRGLDAAIELGVDHVSCYQLTIHEGTPFGFRRERGQLDEMPEREQAELFRATHERLGAAGLAAYEVSNFARSPEHRSRHNLKYWRHVPYLGLGPSAHSFDGTRRFWNERKIKPWQARLDRGERPTAGAEELDDIAIALETVMLGLRTCDGVDLCAFRTRFGIDLVAHNADLVDRLLDGRLLTLEGCALRPTIDGLAVADGMARSFEIAS